MLIDTTNLPIRTKAHLEAGMNITISRLTLLWLLRSSHMGISSSALSAAYFDAPVTETFSDDDSSPSGSLGFMRCCEFLETLSSDEKKIALFKVSKLTPRWKVLVDNWERLEKIGDTSDLNKELRRVIEEMENGKEEQIKSEENKTSESVADETLDDYSVKEELDRLRLFNSVLKKHCCEATPEPEPNAKKPKQ